ncbi:MAG: TrkH family potassium uptake protein [Actinomycetota bacterium]
MTTPATTPSTATVGEAGRRIRRSNPPSIRKVKKRRRQHLLFHIVGLALAMCGAGILTSAVVEMIDGGPDVVELFATGFVTFGLGLFGWRFTKVPERIASLDVFATVAMTWVFIAAAGAVPYLITGTLTSIDDALFESVSGFTTTGATVLRPIEDASAGVLFWRSITQWLGGMGVIVLVVAVLPTMGSGGMDLLEAEAPGPTGERLTPRVAETARRLWGLYIGFTVVLVGAYLAAGMSPYDAVAHSFTTVSSGGFSPYNASIAEFESAAIEWIAIAAMFVAGTSFTLLFRLVRGRPGPLLSSIEFRIYVVIVVVATLVVFVAGDGPTRDIDGFRQSAFVVMAIVTTTGYGLADYTQWSQAAQAVILVLIPLGAMAGSTAGGVKMIRVLAIASFAHRETMRQLHPRLVRPVRIGNLVLDDRVANKVVGFFVLALAAFGGSGILIALTGADLITAFSAAATLFGNVGPGLGDVGPTEDFRNLARPARWVGIGAMLLGRLEIYPILLALMALPLGPVKRLWRRVIGVLG